MISEYTGVLVCALLAIITHASQLHLVDRAALDKKTNQKRSLPQGQQQQQQGDDGDDQHQDQAIARHDAAAPAHKRRKVPQQQPLQQQQQHAIPLCQLEQPTLLAAAGQYERNQQKAQAQMSVQVCQQQQQEEEEEEGQQWSEPETDKQQPEQQLDQLRDMLPQTEQHQQNEQQLEEQQQTEQQQAQQQAQQQHPRQDLKQQGQTSQQQQQHRLCTHSRLPPVCDPQQQQQQQQQQQLGVCPDQEGAQGLLHALQHGCHQQQQQQQVGPDAQQRMSQLAAALAVDLHATDKGELLDQLQYILTIAQAVPRHLRGELAYCTQCKQDLEETLLVYFLVGPDGSPQHKLCRCCFVVAFAAWLKQLPDNGPDMFKGLDQLHPRQQQQFRDWQRAAAAINSSAGQDFQLPSPQHDKLLRGARLLSGQDWPLEYCSLGGGHATVRQLMRGVRQLQQVDVPAYSQLPEVQPSLVDPVLLDLQGSVGLSGDALRAVLSLLKQKPLAEAAKLGPDTPHDAVVDHMLEAVGLGDDTGPGDSSSNGSDCGSDCGSDSSSDSSSDDDKPYFNFNPLDNGVPGPEPGQVVGLSAADAELNDLLGSICDSATPCSYQARGARVMEKHARGLIKAAKAAQGAGRAVEAEALRFLGAVLRTRLSAAVGQVAVHDLLTQVLVLLGGKGTGTLGHLDPAAALTFAYALLRPGQQQQPDAALAQWLFVSPAVFTQLVLLRKLLWLLQELQLQRDVKAARKAVKAAGGHRKKGGRKSKALLKAEAELKQAEAELEAFKQRRQQQQQAQEQQQRGSPVHPAAAAAAGVVGSADGSAEGESDCLTDEEVQWLTSLFLYSGLDAAEMERVHAELGSEYSVLLQQRPGEGVSVPVGWMHWVFNLLPCIKVAWEVVRPQHMAGAGLMQRHLRSRALGLASDYLALVPTAAKEIIRWLQFL